MRIGLEHDQCGATGQCYDVDPDLFPLDEDGYSAIGEDGQPVPTGKEEIAETGINACPMSALFKK